MKDLVGPDQRSGGILRAVDVMSPSVMAVGEDMTVQELARFLLDEEIVGAPVFDAGNRLTGVVSATDITDLEAREPSGGAGGGVVRVRDIMTPTVLTIPDTTPVRDIAKAMIAGRIHRLLVTRGDEVVGIVTPLDLLKALL
jgi:predicted transcriptional regulator